MLKVVLLRRVARWVDFSPADTRAILGAFLGTVRPAAPGLSRRSFALLLQRTYPTMQRRATHYNEYIMGRLFSFANTSRSGFVDFPELAVALSKLLRGGAKARANALFDVLDANGDHTLTVAEAELFFPPRTRGMFGEPVFARTVLTLLARAGTPAMAGKLDAAADDDPYVLQATRKQFVAACLAAPVWYDVFASALLPGNGSLEGAFGNEQPCCSAFDMELMQRLFEHSEHGFTLPKFRVLMLKAFHCPQHMLPFATRAFQVFDCDGSGHLDWFEVVLGFAKVQVVAVQ